MPLLLQEMFRHEIAVGLDIGAMYTKVAYIPPSSQEAIDCCFQGGSNPSRYQLVVPTALFYNSQGLPLGWGYDAIPEAEQLRFFKYSLLPEDHWHPEARQWSALAHSVQARTQLQKTAVDVMVDYINRLWSVCEPQIRSSRGNPHGQQSLRLIVTFPPGWPEDPFKQALRTSVLFNPTCDVRLLTEADAAMESVLRDIAEGYMGNNDLKIGDNIIVADCGSVTVDTVCGTIASTNGNLDCHRVTDATSALCGAAFMTDSFIKTLGLTAGALLTDPAVLGPDFWKAATRMWETEIMPGFQYGIPTTWTFPLTPASLQALKPEALQTHSLWLEKRALPLHSADVHSIFHLAIEKITRLVHAQAQIVRDQTGTSPKYVFFTGGFCCNQYIRLKLQASITNIAVVFLPKVKQRLAVSQGAAIRAMKDSLARPVPAESDFGIEADGTLVRLVSKGEYMTGGMQRRVLLPWKVIQPSYAGGDGIVRLRICRIVDVAKVVHIVKWRPRQPLTPQDKVHIGMFWGTSSVEVVEWVFWLNGLRQSGASYVSEEHPGA